MGFSKSNIQRAGIRHDSRGWGIAGLYGILTRASEQGNEECVEVGRRIIPVSTLEKELDQLSKVSKRTYQYLIFDGPPGVPRAKLRGDRAKLRGELETVCAIGVKVPSLMPAYDHGLISHRNLREVIVMGPQIIMDLKSMGFKRITTADLYLHNHANDLNNYANQY